MNPLDFTKAFTDFWSAQGQAMMQVQEEAGRAMTEGMQAMAAGVAPGASPELSSAASDVAQASQAMMELWSAATSMSAALAAKLPGAGTDAPLEAIFGKITDPRQWLAGTGEMDDALGRMAEGPRFADMWEIERLYAKVLQAWMMVRRRSLEHNGVVLEGWLAAGKRFLDGGVHGGDAKAAMALWTETANKQLLETQRSEGFLTTQRDMIRASTALRLAQQELVEHFGKRYGFPTRTELDDVHRTVTELRRELRMMKREMRAAPAAVPEPVAVVPAARRVAGKQRAKR